MASTNAKTGAPFPLVPNTSPPGQTSGLSWVTPGEGAIFDPLNLLKTPEDFERLRYTEVKHGRVAMVIYAGDQTRGLLFKNCSSLLLSRL